MFKEIEITNSEVKAAFLEVERNKTCGHDNISVNVVKNIFNETEKSLIDIFNLCLTNAFFPQKLKIAKTYPMFLKRIINKIQTKICSSMLLKNY